MITINNALTGAILSTVLTVTVLLTSTNSFGAVKDVTLSTVNELTVDDAEQVMNNGPQLVVMWSLECPACFDELDTLAALLIERPNLAITLISTDDDPSRRDEVNEVYATPALSQLPRWVYGENNGAKLRYRIDPTWQGELPRSYFIDKDGQRHGYSGLLNEKQLNMVVGLLK